MATFKFNQPTSSKILLITLLVLLIFMATTTLSAARTDPTHASPKSETPISASSTINVYKQKQNQHYNHHLHVLVKGRVPPSTPSHRGHGVTISSTRNPWARLIDGQNPTNKRIYYLWFSTLQADQFATGFYNVFGLSCVFVKLSSFLLS